MYLDPLCHSSSFAFFNYLILPASNVTVRKLFNQNKLQKRNLRFEGFRVIDMQVSRSVMPDETCTYLLSWCKTDNILMRF